MLQMDIDLNTEPNCQTSEFENFCIREYVGAIRERDPGKCWPFGSICEFKDLDVQASQLSESLSLISLNVCEDTNAPGLSEVELSKRKEDGSETLTACEIDWTKGKDIETETAMALLEISKGNKTQLETARAFELELTKEKDIDYETDTATEIIDLKELEDGMGEIISDGATELVNLSESSNEEIITGGIKTENSAITDDANSGKTSKRTKKRKLRVLSELLRDLTDPNVKSTVDFDEISDKSDEVFTMDGEHDSDDNTLCMFLKKRKRVQISSRSSGPRTYKKKARKSKPSNSGPKGSKTRTKRTKPHPHDNFATRKLADTLDVVEADMALVAKRKKSGPCGRRGGTRRSIVGQPVAGVGGSQDPDPGSVPVVVGGVPGKRWSLACVLNRNPADFNIPGPGNKY